MRAGVRQFGSLLRAHRGRAGLSQEELAARAGTSTKLIGNLERGTAGEPRSHTVIALADALGLVADARAEFLRGGQPDEPPGGRQPFGALLRTLRERAGMTQDDLAARALLSVRAISDLERGINRAPRRETALLIADGLGLAGADREHFEAAVASAAELVRLRSGRSGAAGQLPVPSGPIIGRAAELDRLEAAVHSAPLVTVVGPAGVGKTRLVLELAHRLARRERVIFLSLAAARTANDVRELVAVALGLAPDGDDLHGPGGAVAAALRADPAVLVLDNLEQVEDADTVVAGLVAASTSAVVATSRLDLRLAGGRSVRLDPLAASPAVQLFLERARAAVPLWQPDAAALADVVELCHLLDRLPLALELAAPAVRDRHPRAIMADLAGLAGLGDLPAGRGKRGSVPHRHRSLQSALAWSYSLLDGPSRTLLGRLAVFPAATDVDTVEVVCGDRDGFDVRAALDTLTEANLVIADKDDGGHARVRMLNTVATFAAGRLAESADADELRRRHAVAMLQLAEAAAPHLVGPDQAVWQAQLGRRIESLRAADDWLLAAGDSALSARLAAALWRFWYLGGRLREGRARLERVLANLAADPTPAAPTVRYGLGVLTYMSGDVDAARELWSRSKDGYAAAGDDEGVANSLNNLGMTHLYAGEPAPAREFYEAALGAARRSGRDRPVAVTLGNVAKLLVAERRGTEAVGAANRALELFRAMGDARAEADLQGLLAEIAVAAGDIATARAHWESALDGFEQLGDPTGTAPVLVALAELDLDSGAARATRPAVRARLERALSIAEQSDDPWTISQACAALAQHALLTGGVDEAQQLIERAATLSAQCRHVEVEARIERLRRQLTAS